MPAAGAANALGRRFVFAARAHGSPDVDGMLMVVGTSLGKG